MYNTKFHTVNLSDFSFLVTGGAGFIGSNIVEYLLKYGAKKVRVLDNFSTGFHHNIEEFKSHPAFELIEGDIRDIETCRKSVLGIDYVLHHAALGSVTRSFIDPITTNDVNIGGFINMLEASRNAKIKRFVFATSSSTYGDSTELPKVEHKIGRPLSPYAITKYVNELYADVFSKSYGIETIGLRYFNVFGPKQDPNGVYAAVIPKFVKQLMKHESLVIDGDGEHSRDFTFIENVIQANILATFVENKKAINTIYNIAYGKRSSLNQLLKYLIEYLQEYDINATNIKIIHGPKRMGDIMHSLASINKAKKLLGYNPNFSFKEGLNSTINWFYKKENLFL